MWAIGSRHDRRRGTQSGELGRLGCRPWSGRHDSAGLVGAADSLTDVERAGLAAAVGSVDGLDVLHVQCHLGFDAISLGRRGARVTGVDFSPVALEKAHDLAGRCGVDVAFVEPDATSLPSALRGRFALAYATIGILCWIADVYGWMASVASALRPGGPLLLIDGHPLWQMTQRLDPLVLDIPYAYDGPHSCTLSGSYAAAGADHDDAVRTFAGRDRHCGCRCGPARPAAGGTPNAVSWSWRSTATHKWPAFWFSARALSGVSGLSTMWAMSS